MVAESQASIVRRRVARVASELVHITTINVAWIVTFDFVWYPGASSAAASLIDPVIGHDPSTGRPRDLFYTWQRDGAPEVRRMMNSGRVTIGLPPGRKGKLTVFDTEWEISRAPNGTMMSAANTMTGVQQRLNRLGYHLRSPGNSTPGIDGNWGRLTETAVVQFQADYVPVAGAPAAAANPLPLRGEWTTNADPAFLQNLQTYNQGTAVANTTATDAANLVASLTAQVGA